MDGLRAVAVAAVMAHHMARVDLVGGFLGVDIFFALSGYLITTLLSREWNARGSVSLKAFFARRALRLLPALVLFLSTMIVATAVLGDRFRSSTGMMLRTAGLALAYVSNWALIYDWHTGWPAALDHLWSLAVEEQFYIVWPVLLLVVLGTRACGRPLRLALAAGVLTIWAWRGWLFLHGASWARVLFGTDCRADDMLVGALIALAPVRSDAAAPAQKHDVLRPLGYLGVAYVVVALFWMRNGDPSTYLGGLSSATVAIGVMLLALIRGALPGLSRLLSLAPLVWAGRLSYGIYLWHNPVRYFLEHARHPLMVLDVVWTIAGTLVCASASYYLVERPFLTLKGRLERR